MCLHDLITKYLVEIYYNNDTYILEWRIKYSL